MNRHLLILVILFLILGTTTDFAQQSAYSEIRILMLSGKKLLSEGDSIGAKEKFESVLKLDPDSESAKILLDGLKNVKTEVKATEMTDTTETNIPVIVHYAVESIESPTPIDEFTTETIDEKSIINKPIEASDSANVEVTVVKEDVYYEETTDNQKHTAPRDPFAGAIRHKNTKQSQTSATPQQTEVTDNKATEAQHTEKKESCAELTDTRSNERNDILYAKYHSTEGPNLLHYSHGHIAPLMGCCSANADADVSGIWMSSIRNMRDNGHEMLTLTIDTTSGVTEYETSRSELLRICSDKGIDIRDLRLWDDNETIKGEIELRQSATNRQELIDITNTLLEPFFGSHGLSDYRTYVWMAEGDLVTDTIVTERTERTVYCTVMDNDSITTSEPLPPNLADLFIDLTEVPDSVVISDTTYVQRRVIADSYELKVKLRLDIMKSDKIMPATLRVKAIAESPIRTISVAETTVPFTFVHVPDGYSWQQAVRYTSAEDSTWYQKLQTAPKDLHNINNLGYALLNGIGTKQDYCEALKHFERSHNLKSKEACANLYLMYHDGLGVDKDIDKAIEILETGRQRNLPESLYLSAQLMSDIDALDDIAIEWMDQAITACNTSAIIMKAKIIENSSVTDKNHEEALLLYTTARDMGDTDGGYHVARMLMNQDSPSEAFTNATSSARIGSAQAMQMIAEMYITGIVVRQDMRKAVMWLKKLEETVSNHKIGYMYEKHDIY